MLDSTAYQDQINKQQQTPYAAQNGMNTGGVQQTALTNAISGGTGSAEAADFASLKPTTSETTTQNKVGPSSTSQASTNVAGGVAGTSPVTGDGKINEANAPAPPTQVQMPAVSTSTTSSSSQPMPLTPSPGPGWIPINGGWVPPGHPLAAQAQAQAPAQTVGAPGWQPAASPQAGTIGSMAPAQQSYAANGMPLRQATTEYNPGTLSQYGGAINTGMEGQVQQALSKAIAGGGGLATELLKGQAKDDGLAMRDNELAAMQSQLAGMGRLGGGFDAALSSGIRENALQGVLGKYRDIGIQDNLARNQFGLQAIGMGNDYLTSQQGRLQDDYKTRLGGELAQEDLSKFAVGNNRDNYLADLQGFLGNKGIDQQAQSSANSLEGDKYRARMGLTGDILNIMERARAGDQQTGLGHSSLLAGMLNGL